jgi:hypothetical protein
MTSPNFFGPLNPTASKLADKPLRFALPEDKVSSRLEQYASSVANPFVAKSGKPVKHKFARATAVKPSKDLVSRKEKPIETKRDDNYREMLKYSRNYAQLMQDLANGTFPQELLPQKREAPKVDEPPIEKKEKLFAISQLKLQRNETKPKRQDGKMKRGMGMLNGPEIWCARCSKKHPADFHKMKAKPPVRSVMVSQQPRQVPRKDPETYSDEYDEESDLSGFIESDEEMQPSKVSQTIRKMFNYDPTRYRDIDRQDDRYMEASADVILREERRSAKIAALEDKEELMRQQGKKGR